MVGDDAAHLECGPVALEDFDEIGVIDAGFAGELGLGDFAAGELGADISGGKDGGLGHGAYSLSYELRVTSYELRVDGMG